MSKETKSRELVSKTKRTELKEDDFPTHATRENIADLIQKGHLIESMKSKWITKHDILSLVELIAFELFLVFIFLAVISFIVGINSLYVISVKGSSMSLWDTFVQMLVFTFASLFGIIALIFGIFIKNILWRFTLYRGFKFPKAKYEVFGCLTAIVECLDKERRKAPNLLSDLYDSVDRYLAMNKRLKYSLEPDLQNLKERRPLQDLLLFSEEKELPILFLNLGLAIVHDNFPAVHTLTSQLRSKFSYPEKKIGRIEVFMNFLEKYEKPILLLLKIISVGLAIVIYIVLAIQGIIPPFRFA